MKTLSRAVCRLLFRISAEETRYVRRRFRGANETMRARLEEIGAIFLHGYSAALNSRDLTHLEWQLNHVQLELRGFAFEGAAMGVALLDRLTPWQNSCLAQLANGAGKPHIYMLHVGVGWIWARLPSFLRRNAAGLDPLLRWLAFDGWGFHEGYFHWDKYIGGEPAPARLRGYETRVFDQGLGRSFWFVNGGNPAWISRSLANFSAERRGDLWSGIGLAATYAGIAGETDLVELRRLAGIHASELAQGAAFAAKARLRAGNMAAHTEQASQLLCDMSSVQAAQLTDMTLENLPADGPQPAYEIWRSRIQNHFRETVMSG